MASKIFVKIDGVIGSSMYPKHLQEIEALSYSFGSFARRPEAQGGGDDVVKIKAVKFTVSIDDISSQSLYHLCARGNQIAEIKLTVERLNAMGDITDTYIKIQLTNCIISTIQPSSALTNLCVIDFAKIKMEHKPSQSRLDLNQV